MAVNIGWTGWGLPVDIIDPIWPKLVEIKGILGCDPYLINPPAPEDLFPLTCDWLGITILCTGL